MKDLSRAQSSLLLRLALAVAESKPPLPSKPAKSERTSEQPEALSEAAWKRLEGLRTRFESELGFADTWLADDPPSSRVEMLLANSSELRKLAILQRFIERAYSFRLDQPREGLQVADNVIAWTKADPSSLLSVIRGRAWMERGNFLRILGDPEGAYAALAQAARELDASGTSDPLELARYQELLGTLERDCGNYEAADGLLRKALAKVRKWGDNYSLQRILIATALTDLYSNRFEEADALLDESLRAAEPDSLLLRFAAVNKILVLYFRGAPHKAYQALLRVQSRLGPSWLHGFPEAKQMSVLWSEGQILNVLGIDDQAVRALRKAREFFIRSNRGYEVCRISIELALSYVAQRRLDDVRRELAFGLAFCSERRLLDQQAMEGALLLQAALEHRGRLEADQVRAVAHQLDCLHRAPLRAPGQRPFPSVSGSLTS
jgi:hypothetical protein